MRTTPDHTVLGEDAHVAILQPAFLGDVVLATALAESWHRAYPNHRISMLVRQEAAPLLEGHPFIHEVLVWNRRGPWKYVRLAWLALQLRRQRPDAVMNIHRYPSMDWVAKATGAPWRSGFAKGGVATGSPGRHLLPHGLGDGRHETERNHSLSAGQLGDWNAALDQPQLHPRAADQRAADDWPSGACVLAPASVWGTKRWPPGHWAQLADALHEKESDRPIILLGGPGDAALLAEIASTCRSARPLQCAGRLGLLGSAALMARASVVVSNDSAPLHMAGAMGTPVVGVFCSTTPRFGFGVLPGMEQKGMARNVEIPTQRLDCKPCGVHGHHTCPQRHFNCAVDLAPAEVLKAVLAVSSPPS